MVVQNPPRQPGTDKPRDRTDLEALREQALIQEARQRARQRRLGNLAVLALGLAVLAQAGFVPGARGRSDTPSANPALLSEAAAGNGKIAIADSTGSLAVVDPDGSDQRSISRCSGLFTDCHVVDPAWSPDAKRLAYVRGEFNPNQMTSALYVSDPDTTRPRLLAQCGSCGRQWSASGISWSPDGTQIAFSGDGNSGGVLSLFTVDTQSGAVQRLTDCVPGSCLDIEPDWSPDGQLIVFSRRTSVGGSLYTVRPDGSDLTKLPSEPGALNPRWSPDGRLIAYHAHDDPQPGTCSWSAPFCAARGESYVVDADGSQPSRPVASGTPGNSPGFPSWSTDGSRLAFLSTPPTDGAFSADVLTASADGKLRQRLVRVRCCVGSFAAPVWSPDGKQLAFSSDDHEEGGTFVVNTDGSGLRRISRSVAVALSWQRVH